MRPFHEVDSTLSKNFELILSQKKNANETFHKPSPQPEFQITVFTCNIVLVVRVTITIFRNVEIKNLANMLLDYTSRQGDRETAQLPDCQVYETEHARSNTILGL